jgi:hypothetical protein
MMASGFLTTEKNNLFRPLHFYPFLLRLFAFIIFYQVNIHCSVL